MMTIHDTPQEAAAVGFVKRKDMPSFSPDNISAISCPGLGATSPLCLGLKKFSSAIDVPLAPGRKFECLSWSRKFTRGNQELIILRFDVIRMGESLRRRMPSILSCGSGSVHRIPASGNVITRWMDENLGGDLCDVAANKFQSEF